MLAAGTPFKAHGRQRRYPVLKGGESPPVSAEARVRLAAIVADRNPRRSTPRG